MPNKMLRVLIVDDDALVVEHEKTVVKAALDHDDQVEFEVAGNGKRCLELLRNPNANFDLVLLDIKMEPVSGAEVIDNSVARSWLNKIIVISDYLHDYSTELDRWVQRGISEVWDKPIKEQMVRDVLEGRRLIRGDRILEREKLDEQGLKDILGASYSIRSVLTQVISVARSLSTVLIYGETGTGKGLIAKAIHRLSPRKDKPFASVNCAALPENLLENELFGHVKGAFTGATAEMVGRFEAADGGTIFLDEIGDASLAIQVKLLRVLQDRQFERVGSSCTRTANVRVIAATNRDLGTAIREKRFREDLFYRLNVIPITVPPLHERQEDIPLLARAFVKKAATKNYQPIPEFVPSAIAELKRLRWPGNIRELESLCERLCVLMKGQEKITTSALKRTLQTVNPGKKEEHSAKDVVFYQEPDRIDSSSPGMPSGGPNVDQDLGRSWSPPRKSLINYNKDELLRAVIFYANDLTAFGRNLFPPITPRPDIKIGNKLKRLGVYEELAKRFKEGRLELQAIARSCDVSEGQLCEALRSMKFVKAIPLEELCRELLSAGQMHNVENFLKTVGGRWTNELKGRLDLR